MHSRLFRTGFVASFFIFSNLAILSSACDSQESSPPARSQSSQQGGATNDSNQGNNQNPGGNNQNNNNDSGGEVVIISESRAAQIMGASCLFADCHAQAQELLDQPAASLLQLQNRTMPPTNQTRYSISNERRNQLIAFFEDVLN